MKHHCVCIILQLLFIWMTLKYMKQLFTDSCDIFICLCKEKVKIYRNLCEF